VRGHEPRLNAARYGARQAQSRVVIDGHSSVLSPEQSSRSPTRHHMSAISRSKCCGSWLYATIVGIS
jgi:hypothetical protein